jgi:hypothetical protein
MKFPVSPSPKQTPPTPAQPLRQRHRMGGTTTQKKSK